MIKFIKTIDKSNEYEISEVVFSIKEGATLSQMLDEYSNFLRSIGYCFDGELEIRENPDHLEDVD